MSLRRQLLLAISFLFLIVFIGLQIVSLFTTREYLQHQLASHAQDAATTLSRTLEEAVGKNDLTLAETQIATLFDRGYYRKIVLLDNANQLILQKELPISELQKSAWLAQWIHLETRSGEAFVSSGWRQLGKVVIQSHPAYAYEFLWQSFKETALWMLAMYLVVCGLAIVLLRIILNPLQKIESVALSIQDRRFETIEPLPQAREFRQVVIAMNQMSTRISDALDEAVTRADQYRRAAFVDPVTGLDNRQSFELRLKHLLSEEGGFSSALLFVTEVDGLKEFNHQFGYQQGDALLSEIASAMREVVVPFGSFMARMGGASLAAICVDVNDAEHLQLELLARIRSASLRKTREVNVIVSGVRFTPAQARGEIFASIDLAIETTRQDPTQAMKIIDLEGQSQHSSLTGVTGSHGWRTLIRGALEDNRLVLYTQSVLHISSGALFHNEAYSRLRDTSGQILPANAFLPMALRHKLMPDIDQALIAMIFERLESDNLSGNVAVNVSLQSIEDREFRHWLFARLKLSPSIAKRISIEVSEFACSKDLPAVTQFVHQLREVNAGFGLDHFVLDASILQFIRATPPDYLKLDASLVREIAQDEVRHKHLQSIVQLARSLQIPLIAQNIENEIEANILVREQVLYGQGYHLASPVARTRLR